ncbi:hypothetical protein NCAS_0D00990 [Naumovozyma castellii]|uniref:Small ribosomal subunit protein uS8m n=1 Tax=Naumovozyma castellii TaxID=27288 RepID=G0VDP2_NAUCA|nr:hypothetical protein NCAS_0D00990 [Naumovozyma castellii CBS 4309]CCC69680.1 hypothetical protein NCAS_0D00990 [Naumovozyma castellii CBS 4309]
MFIVSGPPLKFQTPITILILIETSLLRQTQTEAKKEQQIMSLSRLANTCAHLQNCSQVRTTLTSVPYTKLQLQFAYVLYKQGFISSLQKGSKKGPDQEEVEVTPDNISTRRLWVGLKYRDNKPVLRSCQLVSKPKLRINLKVPEMKKVCSGQSVRLIKPLQPGELMMVRTQGTVMDINEAISKNLGGEILCRIK